MRKGLYINTVMCLLLGWFALPVAAQDISERCQTEPTDVAISYGDSLICSIQSVGDSDIFRFFGSIGDRALVEGEDAGVFGSFGICIELIGPDGATVDDQCNPTDGNRIDTVLNQTGTYTIIVHDSGDDRSGIYEVSVTCLLGTCATPEGDADITVSPANFDFGPVNLNTASTPVTFIISNVIDPTSSVSPRLTVKQITLTGQHASDFSIRTDTCSDRFIPAGLSCRVVVVFHDFRIFEINGTYK